MYRKSCEALGYMLDKNIKYILLSLLLVSACDKKDQESWSEWQELQEKIPYRCGRFGSYEFKVNKDYLFFWPTYEGRSDWDKNKGPPPIGCDMKLSSMPLEAYWPGLSPAGGQSIGLDEKPEHVSIVIESVLNRDRWDLIRYLKLSDGSRMRADEYREDLGLFHFRGVDTLFRDRDSDYYWAMDGNGLISTFIYCGPIKDKKIEFCEQAQFIPGMQASLTIRYKSFRLNSWREIAGDVLEFIKDNVKLKGV